MAQGYRADEDKVTFREAHIHANMRSINIIMSIIQCFEGSSHWWKSHIVSSNMVQWEVFNFGAAPACIRVPFFYFLAVWPWTTCSLFQKHSSFIYTREIIQYSPFEIAEVLYELNRDIFKHLEHSRHLINDNCIAEGALFTRHCLEE